MNNLLYGGSIDQNEIFNNILSIGFEFETIFAYPLYKTIKNKYVQFNDHIKGITIDSNECFEFILSQDTPTIEYYFPDEFTEFKIRNLNCKQTQITHLEFIVTYKIIDKSINIIHEKYNETLEIIKKFINNCTIHQVNKYNIYSES